ncbi:transposase [Mycobacterium pinniadriaticum]|uniref:transposase n=1 Tax=Mycobacterium pinniadriaticum TaxID=2994102 RepID=UPI003969BFD3
MGRSRGGLTSKIHHLVDGAGRPLVVLVSPGQTDDAPLLEHLLAHLRVDRPGRGRPRTRPDRLRGDKAYSSRAIRAELRRRGITVVIPSPQTRSPTASGEEIARRTAARLRRPGLPRTLREGRDGGWR